MAVIRCSIIRQHGFRLLSEQRPRRKKKVTPEPEPPVQHWYDQRPELYSGTPVVSLSGDSGSVTDLGNGDYSMHAVFGGSAVVVSPAENATGVLSLVYVPIAANALQNAVIGEFNLATKQIIVIGASETASDGHFGVQNNELYIYGLSEYGVAAIIYNGKLIARIAFYGDTTENDVEQCFALPLPISAIQDSQVGITNPVQMTFLVGDQIGWYLWRGEKTRVIGFNLPTTDVVGYDTAAPSVPIPIATAGGSYGLEFEATSNLSSVAIWQHGNWLYFT